jgi:uncharacterized protein (DUF58 family)
MEIDELIRIVHKIDILDKSISKLNTTGLYRSTLKGRGLTFDSIRKYEVGDDIRNINWNVTARFRETYFNTFTEDKERIVWILIDVSSSGAFGTRIRTKLDLEIEIAATLIYSCIKKNDAVGVIFFSDRVEKFIKPGKGMAAFVNIAKELVELKPCRNSTNLAGGLQFLMSINHKSSLVFILSDFISRDYSIYCKMLALKHQLIAIRVYDERELGLPKLGWAKLKEAESKREKWVNTSSIKLKNGLNDNFISVENYLKQAFNTQPNNILTINTGENVIEKLLKFMGSR